jgi:protocatechuate 3,4-dioxygenase alpha subunit
VTVAALTPFQTAGPFLSLGLCAGTVADPTVGPSAIEIRGRMLDGRGEPVPDGVVEFWHPSFTEVRRALTTADGTYRTIVDRPGAIDGPEGRVQAPHLAVRVLGRGILTQYLTRMYFPDEPMNASDPVLLRVPEARRATLVATPFGDREFGFDVILQGERETVFFDL